MGIAGAGEAILVFITPDTEVQRVHLGPGITSTSRGLQHRGPIRTSLPTFSKLTAQEGMDPSDRDDNRLALRLLLAETDKVTAQEGNASAAKQRRP